MHIMQVVLGMGLIRHIVAFCVFKRQVTGIFVNNQILERKVSLEEEDIMGIYK